MKIEYDNINDANKAVKYLKKGGVEATKIIIEFEEATEPVLDEGDGDDIASKIKESMVDPDDFKDDLKE